MNMERRVWTAGALAGTAQPLPTNAGVGSI
jgi:hypothetical protein